MISTLITFGGIAFWTIIALYFLFITYLVNKEDSVFLPFVWSAAAVAAVVAFTDIPIPDFTISNVLIGVVAYFGIGVLWSFAKWINLVFEIRNFAQDFEEGKVESNRYNENNTLEVRARSRFSPNDANYSLSLPPKARDFHTRITTWITYWPASVVAMILGDLIAPSIEFLANIGSKLAKAVAGTFSNVSARIYGD